MLEGAGLALWKDPNVRRVTSRSDFDFASFRREAQTLYIAMKREDLETLAPLVRLLFADAIATLQRAEPGRDEPHPVMFLLDEFDQLGRMPIVETAIKTIRSFGGRFFSSASRWRHCTSGSFTAALPVLPCRRAPRCSSS
nr:type IV secretory system conjugative DNA transfer family protein [Haematobacter sp.]